LAVLCVAGAAVSAQAHHRAEPEPFARILTEADRAYDRRAYALALEGFRTALGLATQEDNQVYVRFRLALTLRHLGRPQEARAALKQLASDHPRDTKAPRSLYLAARIREVDLKDVPGAEGELLEILARAPRSAAAGRALRRLTLLRSERDLGSTLDFLRQTYRAHRRGPLGPLATYLAADLYSERAKDPEQAIRLYQLLADRYPKSGLADDALWRAAALLRAAKRPHEAQKLYRRLTATRRESWSLGSYNSVYLDRAALASAHIYLEDLKDPRRALEATREFLDDYPHSLLRSQARFQLVDTLLRLGRRDEAAKEAALLERLHPKSRYAREARRLLTTTPPP
jgi:TolA-binding protein